jgi:hypothetical protein
VPEQSEGERAQTPSDIFLGGENGAVLREQGSATTIFTIEKPTISL